MEDSLYPTIHQTKGWNKTAISASSTALTSLSYNPSNQGLKLFSPLSQPGLFWCLYPTIHQTKGWNMLTVACRSSSPSSLSYNPSNQGLKQVYIVNLVLSQPPVFILQSIKPRVETIIKIQKKLDRICLYPTIHQTKGWNWNIQIGITKTQGVFILQSIKPRVET